MTSHQGMRHLKNLRNIGFGCTRVQTHDQSVSFIARTFIKSNVAYYW